MTDAEYSALQGAQAAANAGAQDRVVQQIVAFTESLVSAYYSPYQLTDLAVMLLNPANSTKTTLLAQIAAIQGWTQAIRDCGLSLLAQASASPPTLTRPVTAADYATLENNYTMTPPYTYAQIVAQSKQ
jgi:hypothetical protein